MISVLQQPDTGLELGVFATKSWKFGRFQKWFGYKHLVLPFGRFWVLLKIWPIFFLICIWYHISQF